ncbi:MAG: hypothetical protein ABFS05_10550, partial [Bacteroidota bacterium]
MKTIKWSERILVMFLMLTGLIFLSVYATSCTGAQSKDKVNEAYELRINGHADSSVILLSKIIVDDPENAMAYYELARTKQHLMLGGGNYKIDEIIENASKASELDPTNLSYAYLEAHSKFLDVYIDIMRGQEEVSEKLNASIAAFEKVLEIEDCYPTVLITLTEINSMLPAEYGGSRDEAIKYADRLGDCDRINALKAYAFLLPEDGDLLTYWLDIYESYEEDAVISEELGRAYLLEGDLENGRKYFEEAISLTPAKTCLYLDLGRAYMMKGMETQDHDLGAEANRMFQQYLDRNPDAPAPMKAFTYRMMALTGKRITGNNELADKYMKMQEETDPFCSRAFGSPTEDLFT